MTAMNSTAPGPAPDSAASPLADRSDALAALVERVAAGTVAVLGRRGTLATAIVWRPGLVVTAAHVFRRSPAAITLVGGDGKTVEATLVGIDSSTDLALFRLADDGRRCRRAGHAGDAAGVRAGHFVDRRRPQRRRRPDRQPGHRQPRRRPLADLARRPPRPPDPPRRRRLRRPLRRAGRRCPRRGDRRRHRGAVAQLRHRRAGVDRLARRRRPCSRNGHVARPWLGIGAQPVPLPERGGRRRRRRRRAACSSPRSRPAGRPSAPAS